MVQTFCSISENIKYVYIQLISLQGEHIDNRGTTAPTKNQRSSFIQAPTTIKVLLISNCDTESKMVS